MNPVDVKPLIALTGATGFIGQWLLRELPKRGYRLRVLLRRPSAVPMAMIPAVATTRTNADSAPVRFGRGDRKPSGVSWVSWVSVGSIVSGCQRLDVLLYTLRGEAYRALVHELDGLDDVRDEAEGALAAWASGEGQQLSERAEAEQRAFLG